MVITKKINISYSDIQSCNSSPVILIPAAGVGKLIHVLSVMGEVYYNTPSAIPYTSNLQLSVGADGAPIFQSMSQFLGLTATTFCRQYFIPTAIGNDINQAIDNDPIVLYCVSGDPTTGTLPVNIYVTYEIIDTQPDNKTVNI